MSGHLKKEALKTAVYQAIRLIRTEEQAKEDYLVWLGLFGKENRFSLVRFVQSYSERHHLTPEEKMLLRDSLRSNLFTINQNSDDTATPETIENTIPLPKVNKELIEPTIPRNDSIEQSPTKKTLSLKESNMATFEMLLNELFDRVGKNGIERLMLIETLKYFLKGSVLPINTQAQFINWCVGKSPSGIERVVTMEEKSAVIHNVYNAICEELGPVEADMILSQSVEHVKSLPCAETVSPEVFL